MASKGKTFEAIVKGTFSVEGVSIDRIRDVTSRYGGVKNIADFDCYHYPHKFYIECKETSQNTLPMVNIKPHQADGLYEKSKIRGCEGFVFVWFSSNNMVVAYPAEAIHVCREAWHKSLSATHISEQGGIVLPTVMKRVNIRILLEETLEILHKHIEEKDRLLGIGE